MRMRLHCLLQRKKIEQELDDELQFHLQRQIEEYTAQGVSGEEAKSLVHVAVVKGWSVNLTGEGQPEQIQGFLASAEFFPVLGVKPVYGRLFQESEDKPGANDVVVIADSLWKRRFGSDPNIVGKAVTLDGSIYRVLGVMPAGVELPREVEMWAPIGFSAEDLSERNHGNEHYLAVGRR